VRVTPSVPVKANSGVKARVPAAGKVLEGDDPLHYLHYITIPPKDEGYVFSFVCLFVLLVCLSARLRKRL